jgi:hypothetical protein
MRLADIDDPQLANMTSPPATHPGELALEQPAPPRMVRARRRNRAARRGVWSPRTTFAYC